MSEIYQSEPMDLFLQRSSIEKAVKTLIIRSLYFILSVVTGHCTAYSKDKEWIRSVVSFDASTNVIRGGDVDIILTAVPNYGNTIAFEIQSTPHHGTVTTPVNLSDHTALISYHHDGTKKNLEDIFSFRTSSVGMAKSVAYHAKINIHSPPALLVFKPKILNFGEVMLSESRCTNVTVSNVGGKKVTGKLLLPGSFSSPDGNGFTLDEGETTNLTVCFSPMAEGEKSDDASILPALQKEPLILKGIGVPRFTAKKIDALNWNFKNLSTNKIRISFAGGDGWVMPGEIPIPPQSESLVVFKQSEVDALIANISSKDTHVQISDGLCTNEIELPQPKRFIPLSVQQVSHESLGSVSIGSSLHIIFQFQNRSDSSKQVKWQAHSVSGGGMPEAKCVEVGGGSVHQVDWDWTPSLPGDATLKISVTDGSKSLPEIMWKAKVFAGLSARESLPLESDGSVPQEKKNDDISPPALSSTIASNQMPAIEEILWGSERSFLGRQSVFIEWKSPTNRIAGVTVDEIALVRPSVVWALDVTGPGFNLPPIKFQFLSLKFVEEKKGDAYNRISISNLSAGCHLLKLTLRDHDGRPVNCSTIQMQISPEPSPWTFWMMPLGILVLILLILFLRLLRRGM